MSNRTHLDLMHTQIVVPCYHKAARLDADAFAGLVAERSECGNPARHCTGRARQLGQLLGRFGR